MAEADDWREFLEAKGTLHIVAELGEEPREYSELEETIPVSSSTLSRRLKEGVRLDAWELERIVTKEVDRTVYQLERSGQHVYNGLNEQDAVADFDEFRELSEQIDDIEDLLIGRLPDDD